jgi:hypothetical protein
MREGDRFEREVRAALGELVATPVLSGDLFDRVRAGHRRRRHVRVGALAAVAVLGVTLAVNASRPSVAIDPAAPAVALPTPRCWPIRPEKVTDATDPRMPGIRDQMVPGAPRLAVMCRYAGLNERATPETLTNTRTVTGPALDQLVRAASTGRPGPTGPMSCPPEYGSHLVIVFVYADAARVIVNRLLSGCRFITNGFVSRRSNDEQGVMDRLLGSA